MELKHPDFRSRDTDSSSYTQVSLVSHMSHLLSLDAARILWLFGLELILWASAESPDQKTGNMG